MPIKLKSIKAEAEACKKAWKGMKVGTRAVHCHHETMTEELTEVATNRINYILAEKPLKEQALRLRLFRPVKGPAWDEYQEVTRPAWKTYEDITGQALKTYEDIEVQAWKTYKDIKGPAHKLICKEKNCPWNGKTIFP